MKYLIYIIAFFSLNIFAQTKYLTKTGTVHFEGSVSSFEEVKATNNSVTAIINTENGEFASLILVKGFRFKNALMEEHFNENYAESDTYPKATFKGKLKNFDVSKLTQNNTNFYLNGDLTFHGKTHRLENLKIQISKDNGYITFIGNFKTKASYFDIKIPRIVSNKIAEDIEVQFNFNLKKK